MRVAEIRRDASPENPTLTHSRHLFSTRGVLAQLRLLAQALPRVSIVPRGEHAVSVVAHELLEGDLKVSRLGSTGDHPSRMEDTDAFSSFTFASVAPLRWEISTSIRSAHRTRSADVSPASTGGAAKEGSAPVEDVSAIERLAAARRASCSAWATRARAVASVDLHPSDIDPHSSRKELAAAAGT